MLELVLVACLTAAPGECKDISLVYAETLTPMQCLMQAQPQIAKWADEHPNWRVARWSCRPVGRFAKT